MELILVVVGLIIGLVIGFLFAKSKFQSNSSSQLREEQQKYVELDRTFVDFKATSNS